MLENCERTFHNIGVAYWPRIVRIANDQALLRYFQEKGRRGAIPLAAFIRSRTKEIYGNRLPITEKSLAAEIYYHFRVLHISLKAEKRFGQKRFTQWIIRHMNIIDCGGMKEDTNRFVWDILSIFW